MKSADGMHFWVNVTGKIYKGNSVFLVITWLFKLRIKLSEL